MFADRRGAPIFLGLGLLILLMAGALAEMPNDRLHNSRGAAVLIRARSFAPGDILLLTLESDSLLREVIVRFEGRDYVLRVLGRKRKPLALIGLDLSLKPGPHEVRATFI
jgi:hypothetical protein